MANVNQLYAYFPKKIEGEEEKSQGDLSATIIKKYEKYLLSPEQLFENNYPSLTLNPTFSKFGKREELRRNPYTMIYSMDCEMVVTSEGLELAQVTVIDFGYRTVYESYVKPSNQILNYNTK